MVGYCCLVQFGKHCFLRWVLSGWTLVLFDSHAESDLVQPNRCLVLAGALVSSAPRTLLGYANLSCLMDFQSQEDE